MPRQPMIASTPGTLGMAAVHGLGSLPPVQQQADRAARSRG
jgi:hypothetical protein